MRRIVVIGGGAAGLKAAARARRRDEEAEITVIEESEYPSMARCGLPYYIEGIVPEIETLLETPFGATRDVEYFKKTKNIDILARTKTEHIDRNRKVVEIVRDGSSDEILYDYLVLATGSEPVKLNVPGCDAEGVFSLHTPHDAVAITELWEKGIDKAVIVGGGLIGMECAEALTRLGIKVITIEMLDHILPTLLDAEIAALVTKHLEEKGVSVITKCCVEEILTKNGKVSGLRAGGKELSAQIVLVSIGVRPNVELAKQAGIAIGETGAIKVNKYLQTSDPYIYAGGDCIENGHIVTGKPVYTPLGSTANKHGRVIGDNVTGGETVFPGVVGTAILRVFDFTVACTGLTEKQAIKLGYQPLVATIPALDRPHFFPGQKPIRLKVVANQTGRLLGAQGVGLGFVDKRIDVLATALQLGATIDDITDLDLAYSPPFSVAIDAVITAGCVARNKRDGLMKGISPLEVKRKLAGKEDFVLLDVRTHEEFAKLGPISSDERVIHMPLDELRNSLDKLPKNKATITFCQIGIRGYEAARILSGGGFKDVRVMEGGIAFWGL